MEVTPTDAQNRPGNCLSQIERERRKEFNEKHRDWIAEQNAHLEKNGLWCDGVVPWMEKS